jgi:hypothetical protein
MALRAALALGIRKVDRTKRMVMFAWIVNILIALVLAGPMLTMLNASIAPTVMEERLTEKLDLNWLENFGADHPGDPLARLLHLAIFGAGPFYEHLDGIINGKLITTLGSFLGSMLFEFRLRPELLELPVILSLGYILVWVFLSGAFIGMYARDQRSSFGEFLQFGARFFGKFFRLALIQLVLYIGLFALVGWVSGGIGRWTANEPSELTAYTLFMIRNAAVLIVLGAVILCFDYAKIRMVVESRVSALAGFGAGVRFVVAHPFRTITLGLILALIGAVFTTLFILIEAVISQSSFWMIALLFLVQQLYVWSRQWLRAAFYATETALFQETVRKHAAEVLPAEAALNSDAPA